MASQSGNNDAGSSGPGISSELRTRDLPSKRLLGKGLASIVYETEWNGERFARKDFIGVPSGAFQKEAAILVGLQDHENVVKTHARTVDKMSCSLVLEYMEEDLLDVLQKKKESQREASGTASGSRCEGNPSYPFELAEALAILSQIARGMEFLHEQNIPHGDLKTKNVLVSHKNDGDKNVLSVKVADFGLVRTKSKSMSFVSRQARKLDVVQWKAPEVLERLLLEDNDVTTSESDSNSETELTGSVGVSERLGADVYSFAVTCSQILTGEGPYPNGNWKELGCKIVSGELRPNLPAACPGLLKSLLESCWTKSLARRPTFSFIRELLDFWLVDPEVPGHLSLKEVREKNKFLDSPPPLAEKPMRIIQPRKRSGHTKLSIEVRPPSFKRKLWFGTYEPEEIERAKDAINYYMGSNLPYYYSDSPKIFAGIPLKGIQFKDLQPSCEQFIQVGNKNMRASAFFARQVKEAILSVTGRRKKSVSLERKHPLGPPRETSPSPSHEKMSSTTEGQDSATSLPSSKISPSGEDWLYSSDSEKDWMSESLMTDSEQPEADSETAFPKALITVSNLRTDVGTLSIPPVVNPRPVGEEERLLKELRAKDLPSKRLLGKGLASIVYETEWNGERFARKDFIGVPSGAFQKEAAILVGLQDHENVVKTHARTVDKMSCSLVLEYMEEDLLDVLQKRKESQREASGTASGSRCEENPSYPFELAEALAILSQIARGMESLHEQNIPHGDLKTKNVLVSHKNDGDKNVLSVKVADFGLVRTKSKSMSFVSRQARKLDVVQWKAPEVLERLLSEDNDVTTSESDSNSETELTGSLGVSERLCADVYSFAVTCSQILTGEGPYPNGNWKELGCKIVSGELRPNLPAACPGLLKSLLESCWTKSLARRPTFSFIRELLDFWLVDPEIPKLKLLNTPSGNGGPKGDHHVAADQAREIVRQAVVAVTEAGAGKQQQSSAVKKGTVRYRECQKNHAASIGGHAIDGCGEFMPGGEDGSVDALRCAACDCHRNFHRREVEGEIVCDCKKLKPKLLSTPQLSQAPGMTENTTTTTSTISLPWSQQLWQMTPLTMAALSAGGGPTDSDEPDDGPADHMMMSMRSPSAIKKRFRTKFTTEQNDQMCAFAEKVGWRIQKQDEAAVQEFCTTVGVKRHVLKVWMHNNKHTMWKSKP